HRIEAHQNVETESGQGFSPRALVAVPGPHKIEQGQQWDSAAGEYLQLVTELGQDGITGIDDIDGGIAVQRLSQHLGLLLETAMGLRRVQKALDTGRPVQTRSTGGGLVI